MSTQIVWSHWWITAAVSSSRGHNAIVNQEVYNFWTDAADITETLEVYYSGQWGLPLDEVFVNLVRAEVVGA